MTSEYGRVRDDVDRLRRRSTPSSARPKASTSWRSRTAAASSPASRRELEDVAAAVGKALDELELRTPVLRRARRAGCRRRDPRRRRGHRRAGLGRDDAADVPALGRAARLRGGGRRGLRGRRGRHPVGDLHRAWALRLRAAGRRAGRAPPRPDVAVRLPAPAPDELRLPRRGAVPRGPRRARSTSTRRTFASTRTARRGPAAST